MSIGSRIKELRENKNISRIEFATMIGVTVGAVSNYENDVSSPKEPILFKIIEALDCDANYLFQDVVKIKAQKNDVTLAEYDLIKKIRYIKKHSKIGTEAVLSTIEREYERIQDLSELKAGQYTLYDAIGSTMEERNDWIRSTLPSDIAERLIAQLDDRDRRTGFRLLPSASEQSLNAANDRTDIEVTAEMKKEDDAFFDED